MKYLQLMRLHKPIGIFLLLWPTLWALWIASHGHPHFKNVVIFVLGVILMRSAGCVINDFADKDFDFHVTRTKNRPITTGEISKNHALILFLILCAVAFALVLLTNAHTIFLSFLALAIAIFYPFTKRFFHCPQMILGVAFSMGVPMAFTAENTAFTKITWLLMLANIFWVILYDTEYAMTDREDDLKIGVQSTAIFFGKYDSVVVGLLQIAVLVLLIVLGVYLNLLITYFIFLFAAMLLFFYQQYLMMTRDPQKCFQAFLNNHWVGLIIFLGILCSRVC